MCGTRTLQLILSTACCLALLVPVGPAIAGAPQLNVGVNARSISPGEPLIIRVGTTAPLESLEGRFLERSVFMTRTSGPEGREVWLGWSMIGLDQPGGQAEIEIRGRDANGSPVRIVHPITIEEKAFPREELKVAPGYVSPPPEVQARLKQERKKLAGIYESRQPVEPSRSAFIRPVPGEQTSIFGTRRIFNGQPRSPHSGLDLRAAVGTEVKASGSGEVVLAQDLYYSGDTVILDHGGGFFTLYAHLSEIFVEEGDPVDTGQLVGLSGATGRVTGPHLHWGAKIGNEPFDPTALLDDKLWQRDGG